MKFSSKNFSSKSADLVTFTGEILNAEIYSLCSVDCSSLNFSLRAYIHDYLTNE